MYINKNKSIFLLFIAILAVQVRGSVEPDAEPQAIVVFEENNPVVCDIVAPTTSRDQTLLERSHQIVSTTAKALLLRFCDCSTCREKAILSRQIQTLEQQLPTQIRTCCDAFFGLSIHNKRFKCDKNGLTYEDLDNLYTIPIEHLHEFLAGDEFVCVKPNMRLSNAAWLDPQLKSWILGAIPNIYPARDAFKAILDTKQGIKDKKEELAKAVEEEERRDRCIKSGSITDPHEVSAKNCAKLLVRRARGISVSCPCRRKQG